jgi:hypothetical protein
MSKSKSQIAKLEAAVQAQKEEAEEKEKVLNEGEKPEPLSFTDLYDTQKRNLSS